MPRLILILMSAGVVAWAGSALAQVMESTNYQIQSDSINLGGGLASSTSFRSEDTLGEIGTGNSASASYQLRAGYQQMGEVYLALSAAADVTMSGLGGVTGGVATGFTTATATTDSLAGYSLSIKASSSPAMEGNDTADSIADYAPGADPSFAFSFTPEESAFGFSPEGDDIAPRFRDDGSICNSGSGDTADACFDGLSTSDAVIATRPNSNHPNGTATTLQFRVGVGSARNQSEGTYTATTTLTLIAL